jgi:uncharacterized protein DUF5658
VSGHDAATISTDDDTGGNENLDGRETVNIKPELRTLEIANAPDMSHSPALPGAPTAPERRNSTDRRKRTVHALLYGSFNPRRRNARRVDARSLRDLDWHEPQWLAVAMLITLLSCIDAGLTLTLIAQGAYEVNPFMAPIVGGSALVFTLVKVGLTAGGVVMLTLAARMRAFGKMPVGFLLYAVLLVYGTLVIYELRLLQEILF